MDDLWKDLAPRVEARPDLAAGGHIHRHCHDACDVYDREPPLSALRVPRQRQRTTDDARHLSEPPARPAHPRFQDFARVHDRLPTAEALAETAADREGE